MYSYNAINGSDRKVELIFIFVSYFGDINVISQ